MAWQKVQKRQKSLAEMLATAGVVVLIAVSLTGCIACSAWQGHGRRPAWLSVQRPPYQACAVEDGSGDYQTYPCVWDAELRGNHERGPDAPRWTTYARIEEGCPVSRPGEVCTYVPDGEWIIFDRSCPVEPYDEVCRYEPGD
jgi:hypothetical protein